MLSKAWTQIRRMPRLRPKEAKTTGGRQLVHLKGKIMNKRDFQEEDQLVHNKGKMMTYRGLQRPTVCMLYSCQLYRPTLRGQNVGQHLSITITINLHTVLQRPNYLGHVRVCSIQQGHREVLIIYTTYGPTLVCTQMRNIHCTYIYCRVHTYHIPDTMPLHTSVFTHILYSM